MINLSLIRAPIKIHCPVLLALISSLFIARSSFAFEGRISATLTRGGEAQALLYTVGTNTLRIERTETNWPYAKNLVALDTGDITLLFPGNRSFVQLKPAAQNASPGMPGVPGMMPMPPSAAPQPAVMPGSGLPNNIGPTNLSGMPALPSRPMPQMPITGGMPAMPMMPPQIMEKMELRPTGQTTNLLGYTCSEYELKQRGEVMEVWATDQLIPFQSWLQNQQPRFGPRRIEDQWSELLKAKKLFPLLASLKFENGVERLHFEVRTVTPEKITDGNSLFQPPPDYNEIAPLPF